MSTLAEKVLVLSLTNIAGMPYHAVHVCLVLGRVGVPHCEAAVRITLASSLERISSSKESSACEISGLIEARSDVYPYHCLTSLGSSV